MGDDAAEFLISHRGGSDGGEGAKRFQILLLGIKRHVRTGEDLGLIPVRGGVAHLVHALQRFVERDVEEPGVAAFVGDCERLHAVGRKVGAAGGGGGLSGGLAAAEEGHPAIGARGHAEVRLAFRGSGVIALPRPHVDGGDALAGEAELLPRGAAVGAFEKAARLGAGVENLRVAEIECDDFAAERGGAGGIEVAVECKARPRFAAVGRFPKSRRIGAQHRGGIHGVDGDAADCAGERAVCGRPGLSAVCREEQPGRGADDDDVCIGPRGDHAGEPVAAGILRDGREGDDAVFRDAIVDGKLRHRRVVMRAGLLRQRAEEEAGIELRVGLFELIRAELPRLAVGRGPRRPDIPFAHDAQPRTTFRQFVARDAARAEVGEIRRRAQAFAGGLHEVKIAAPVPVDLVAVLACGESHPCAAVHRFAASAVVVIDADGRGEVAGDLPRDGVHSVSEKAERIRAGLVEPELRLRVADIARCPAWVHGVSGDVECDVLGVDGVILVVGDARPECIGSARQRSFEFQPRALVLRELELPEVEDGFYDRLPVCIHDHIRAAGAVVSAGAFDCDLRKMRVAAAHERIEWNRLPRDAGAFPMDVEIAGG